MEKRKVLVSLPERILEKTDAAAFSEGLTRSALIGKALWQYLQRRHMVESGERMKRGYEQMAEINRAWAQEGIEHDLRALDIYEAMLAESEES